MTPLSTRRQFLKSAGALAAPTVIPASALGLSGTTAPSNRIVLGCIGVGSQGTGNMRNFLRFPEAQIVAVCDVDRQRRESARQTVLDQYRRDTRRGSFEGCEAYADFREVIDRPDIDALSIALPDHWHAIPVVMAARAGKNMYAEKPLALTIAQGRAMADAVRRYGVIFQTGSQQRSDRRFRFACELVRNGRLGELRTIEVGLPSGPRTEPQPEMPVPEGFDYDFWLGPAPWAPYTELRCHWNFRWILDYSGGQLTDWGAHHCDIAQWGLGTTRTGPVEFEGHGEYPPDGLYDAATDYAYECRYENGVRMIVSSRVRGGVTFRGSEGWVFVNRGVIEADPPGLLTTVIAPQEVHLYESANHHANFLACVRTRREPIAPIEEAHRSITISHIGNICMRLGRKVRWDPDRERFNGDAEADRMLSRAMRAPWSL